MSLSLSLSARKIWPNVAEAEATMSGVTRFGLPVGQWGSIHAVFLCVILLKGRTIFTFGLRQ